MLDDLNHEDYIKQKNTNFQLTEVGIELELIEISDKISMPEQEMFSLIFRGAKDAPLEQKIYRMKHEILGVGELFIVPIALDDDGYKYEAGFNRLISN